MKGFHRLNEEGFLANLALPEHRISDLTFGNVSVADQAALSSVRRERRALGGAHSFLPGPVSVLRLKK